MWWITIQQIGFNRKPSRTQNIFSTTDGMYCWNIKNVPPNTHSHNTIKMIFFLRRCLGLFYNIDNVLLIQSLPQCNSAASLIREIWSSTKMQATGDYWKIGCSRTYFLSSFRFRLFLSPSLLTRLLANHLLYWKQTFLLHCKLFLVTKYTKTWRL